MLYDAINILGSIESPSHIALDDGYCSIYLAEGRIIELSQLLLGWVASRVMESDCPMTCHPIPSHSAAQLTPIIRNHCRNSDRAADAMCYTTLHYGTSYCAGASGMEGKQCAVRHFCESSCSEIATSVPKRVSEASRAEQKWALQGSERRT